MKLFTAYSAKLGLRIITVKASDETEAYLKIHMELNTSNRQSALDQWIRNGAWIVEMTGEFVQ